MRAGRVNLRLVQGVPEGQTVVAGAGGQVGGEVLAHRDLAAEAGSAGHLGEGEVGALQKLLSCGDALSDQPAQGCGARGRLEVASEGAGDMPARAARPATVCGSARWVRA